MPGPPGQRSPATTPSMLRRAAPDQWSTDLRSPCSRMCAYRLRPASWRGQNLGHRPGDGAIGVPEHECPLQHLVTSIQHLIEAYLPELARSELAPDESLHACLIKFTGCSPRSVVEDIAALLSNDGAICPAFCELDLVVGPLQRMFEAALVQIAALHLDTQGILPRAERGAIS